MTAKINIDKSKFDSNASIFGKIIGYTLYVLFWIGSIGVIIGASTPWYGIKGEHALLVGFFSLFGLFMTHVITQGDSPIHKFNKHFKLFAWKQTIKDGSES